MGSLDNLSYDLMNNLLPFIEKGIVMGVDFWEILPNLPHCIMGLTIKNSIISRYGGETICKFVHNMRTKNYADFL